MVSDPFDSAQGTLAGKVGFDSAQPTIYGMVINRGETIYSDSSLFNTLLKVI